MFGESGRGRRNPRSRRHPQFSSQALASSLPACDIAYLHEGALGGTLRTSTSSRTLTASSTLASSSNGPVECPTV
ncbi:MAG TPA: DUF488 family protein [Solirubrobacteraceae bacterium]